jgi:hypothetical protein
MSHVFRACAVTAAFTAAAVLGACRHADEPPKPATKVLTQHEKDSILGQSLIPGAGVVNKALKLQDSLNKRTGRADSIGRDTLH